MINVFVLVTYFFGIIWFGINDLVLNIGLDLYIFLIFGDFILI